jgi:casein kinase 1
MTYYDTAFETLSLVHFAEIIDILENIHKCGIIHRDIKTSNFMLKNDKIHLIDFGFSTFYVDANFKPFPNEITENIIGTPPFVSINIHNGNTPSRRDDLISVGYIYLFLSYPLDLDDLTIIDKDYEPCSIKNANHLKWRERKKWENLSKGLDTDSNIFKYLRECYELTFDENPQYSHLRDLLVR